MKPQLKYQAIYSHRDKYPITVMCEFFSVSRSGYYCFVKRMNKPEKNQKVVEIIAECQKKTNKTYGYRRVHEYLSTHGIKLNRKTVLRLMNKYNLLSEIRRRRKYRVMSQQLHRYPNLLNRDFNATRPNEKWVTDISYIFTKQGVMYLSIIRDLYDNSIVAYNTGIMRFEIASSIPHSIIGMIHFETSYMLRTVGLLVFLWGLVYYSIITMVVTVATGGFAWFVVAALKDK